MSDNVEPTDSELEHVNDAAPDVEQPVPDESALSAEEYAKEMAAFKSDGEKLTFRQQVSVLVIEQQIQHWLRYQYSKMHKLSAKDSGKENLFTILLHHLVSLSVSKPHKPQAFALWAKANAAQVQQAWDQELKKKNIPAGERAVKLNAFKSKLFKKESDEVQQQWAATAEEEHEDAMKEYNDKIESPVLKDPADVQRCLEHLPSVWLGLNPQTEVVCMCLRNFHAGKTLGNIKQNFIQVERANYRKYMVPMFANFLKKCFTVEMCRTRALAPNTPTLESIGFTSEEQGVALDAISGNVYNNAGDRVAFDDLPTTKTPSSGVPVNGAILDRMEGSPPPATPSRAPLRVLTPLPVPPLNSPSHVPTPLLAPLLKSPTHALTPPLAPPLKPPSRMPTPPSRPPSHEPNLPPSHGLPLVPSRAPSLAPTPAPSPPRSPAPSRQATPAPPPASKPPSLARISHPISNLGEGMNPTASTSRGSGEDGHDKDQHLGEGREEAISREELSEGLGARSSKKCKQRVGAESTRPKKQAKTKPDEATGPMPKINKGKKKGTTSRTMVAQPPDKTRPVNSDTTTETLPVTCSRHLYISDPVN
ncbi:hypothetical protein ARMSODRAFT_1023783 [Armillaria solidipes]|uniref:Uncharacterized protein n=1 Tax=Armillaria solidipes TaxID=1076256 RepID=A0A2H3B1I0_9AGAR|nr:hypothetical protein ARMSODRAFT_1023783 [Armillaria solidipes]